MEDAKVACSTGVDGVDLVIGTSSFLREFSHGKSMAVIQKTALEVIEYVKRCVLGSNHVALLSESNFTIIARELKSDSHQRIPSAATSSTFLLSTRR